MKNKFLAKFADLNPGIKRILSEAEFDPETGTTKKYKLPQDILEEYFGNGDSLSRRGSVLRGFFVVRSYYNNGVERVDDPIFGNRSERDGVETTDGQSGGKYAIRLEGYAASTTLKASVPKGMKKIMVDAGVPPRCAWNGSTNSIQVDHREGRPQKAGFTVSKDPKYYQFLSEHNNQVKRSACRDCVRTGKRFNAQERLGVRIAFTEGGPDFDIDGAGCRGCALYDLAGFWKSL